MHRKCASWLLRYCLFNKKAVLSQRRLRNVPYICHALKIFGTPWLRQQLLFPKFYGLLFRWYRPKERWWVRIGPPYIPVLFFYQHSFVRNFRLQFSVGVANPKFWGRGCRRGSGMIPLERALVSFYRPSIVTFPLSLRVSEILPLMFSRTPLFPYSTSSLPKISPCFHGTRWIAFWLQRAKVRANRPCN